MINQDKPTVRILAIDPGPTISGVMVFDPERFRILFAADVDSALFLQYMLGESSPLDLEMTIMMSSLNTCVVEDITHMGMAVGKSVFETAKYIGDFRTAWRVFKGASNLAYQMSRQDVKTVLCGGSNYRDPVTGRVKAVNDTVVKRAVMAKFPASGGGATPEIGTKKEPGPLFVMKGKKHSWAALALAIAHIETIELAGEVE